MIFNKSSNGAAELKELIGFIYKSITFANLSSYIEFATRDLKKIIGAELYQQAEDHYLSANYHWVAPVPDEGETAESHPEYAILDELVKKIQYPLAVHAYRMYVPSSDLTHSDKGRQIFVSEQEKPAFEWQIEKDNENLLSLAHRATDILLEWLDANIAYTVTVAGENDGETVEEVLLKWADSAAYLSTKDLFINNVDEFEKVFLIENSRVTFLALVPFIRRFQHNDILAIIGKDRYDELLAAIASMEDGEEPVATLLDKVRTPLALMAMSVAVKRLSAQILPSGIFSNIVTGVVKSKNASGKIDRNEVSNSLEKDGLKELVKLQEHIRKLDLTEAGETYTAVDPSERIDETLKFVRL